MTQDDLTAERAAKIRVALLQDLEFRDQFTRQDVDPETKAKWDRQWDEIIVLHLKTARQEALREIRQVCVDYEDCCVLGLVAHGDKAVTNASIGAIQFIRRHIDDRLASEGG